MNEQTDDDYTHAQAALRRTLRPDVRHAAVVVENCTGVTARYSAGAVHDLTATSRSGAVAHWITEQGASYRTVDSTEPTAITALLRDETASDGTTRPDAAPADLTKAAHTLTTLMSAIDAAARDHDTRVRQVVIDAEHESRTVTAVGPEHVHTDRRHLRYLTVRVIAEENGTIGTGTITPATSAEDGELAAEAIGTEVARRAILSLRARPAPIAHMPVVVGPGRGMVLIHEACCHPLEGDEVLRNSVYAGRLGERIAHPGLTIVDDPLVDTAVGSYRYDDEGTPAAATTLIEDGRLVSYLTDQSTAVRLGLRPTGNGRRDAFRSMALPRMSNTCVAAGTADPAEVIGEVEYGLYATHVGGGEVVEATGEFVFRVLNGFLIEHGELTEPVGETTLRGNGTEVLRGIDAVCNDVALSAAKCGKFGQLIPVGVQGPTLRINSLLVGGTDR